jgi:hypothetical protein
VCRDEEDELDVGAHDLVGKLQFAVPLGLENDEIRNNIYVNNCQTAMTE